MNGSDAALYDGSRGQVPEPVFQDVPFDESEWRALYDILRQVNQPKAELMRVQYEVVRTAYQHYMSARAEERNAYAMQRADDEAYNRAVAEQRLAVEAQIREVRERWRPVLEQRRRELEQALQEAYLRAGEAGMNLRGGAFLGIGLDDAEPSEWDTPQAAQPATPAPQPSISATRLPETRTTTPLPAQMEAPYEYRTAYPADSPDVPSEPPFSAEEAAYETRMPTAQPRTAFRWLHWLAPIAVGVLLGQLLLKAFGIELTDWQNPLVWIAPLAGALAMMVWYRALWNASRALSEMYYLFNWGAGQARRIAWMAGIATLAVVLLPTAILMSAMLLVPTVPNGAMLLPALLATLLMLPLAVLAVTGGYFHGRQEIVSNTVQARVHAARREQAREARAARERPESRPSLPAEPAAPPTQPMPTTAAASPSGDGVPPSTPPPATTIDSQERRRAAFAAIANARAADANYQRAKQELEEELAPLLQELQRLQPRPIYPDLPPHAKERLRALYQQWQLAYIAMLNYVAEAARDCKDGEQIAQHIAAFKDTLPR
ncbi:MAG: hypothetical protein RQ971_06590 [Armatimonadota bacterium]|nr:hypothetical protein [Armatimonadota bacterium]